LNTGEHGLSIERGRYW